MLMHRKNNQKGIKKPTIGHNKANWFWRIKKTLRIIRVTTWVTRIFYSKSVLGFGINQHSQSFIVHIVLRNCHVYASQLPCLCFASTMFMLRKYHVYASWMPCLQYSNDDVLTLQTCFAKNKKMLKRERFHPDFA